MHGEEGHWSGRDQSNAVSSQAMLRITGNHQKLVSLVAHMVKSLPAKQEGQIWSLSQEDTLKKRMTTHSSILSCRIPWAEEPGGLQSIESKKLDTTEWLTLPPFFFFLPEARQVEGNRFSKASEGTNPAGILISDFYTPELWENKFLLFGAVQFV